MKAADANAIFAVMFEWDAGVTAIGHCAMLLFQGVSSSNKSKKNKIGTMERL